jgi:hypothetical protein
LFPPISIFFAAQSASGRRELLAAMSVDREVRVSAGVGLDHDLLAERLAQRRRPAPATVEGDHSSEDVDGEGDHKQTINDAAECE